MKEGLHCYLIFLILEFLDRLLHKKRTNYKQKIILSLLLEGLSVLESAHYYLRYIKRLYLVMTKNVYIGRSIYVLL